MSRIGKLPVAIPEKVKASVSGNTVSIEGPKGSITKSFNTSVTIELADDAIVIQRRDGSVLSRAMHGTARSIVQGMVDGVVRGYSKDLIINGVGFRATVRGSILDLSLGYSHPIAYSIPEGITVTVVENTKVKVEGIDKQMVGQVAADIKAYYPVEPYKGKGVQIVGEFVRRKEGKKTA
jgi:large subunit ribosomal protein L6